MQIISLISAEWIKYLGCMIIGGLVGLVISNVLNHKEYQIAYISQEELLKFEAERIAKEQTKELFFGKVDKAAELAVEIGKNYEQAAKDKVTKVVYSLGAVSGNNVYSLSKEVHKQIVNRLSK
jgi:hypothetical protein